ncbi:MAG: glycosyltransferase [Phycisphaeraceae bacterium]|nr:MAG: glycosyltransferase [Phycisphaeraceae bacterium]
MRILMLGWEFPPFISGGLGTACYGLTRALDALGHQVLFVLPRAIEGESASHVTLLAPEDDQSEQPPAPSAADEPQGAAQESESRASGGAVSPVRGLQAREMEQFLHARFLGVDSPILNPYRSDGLPVGAEQRTVSGGVRPPEEVIRALRASGVAVPEGWTAATSNPRAGGGEAGRGKVKTRGGKDYDGDIYTMSQEYARLVLTLCGRHEFDVIHAHDWMTYPAGMALARATGKPLVAHIHSTEFDRSGEHVVQGIYDIERRGMHAAVRVLAVSELTRSIVTARYGVEKEKISVVYNGIQVDDRVDFSKARIESRDKLVLFLGRITMQKGPEYFIGAAKRVLEKMPNVKFIVAGSGDMAVRTIELAAAMGIGHKVLFAGFLRGSDVDRIYQMADLYVMPSVSEPFGIAPLEAIRNDTPVLISKTSGVSEVLRHALKVDFWDVEEMANKILAVLRHPPLSQMLRKHGSMEVRRLTWEGAAEKCIEAYERSIEAMVHHPQADTVVS